MLCMFLVVKYDYGLLGINVATAVNNFAMLALISMFSSTSSVLPTRETLAGLGPHICLAVSAFAMMSLEYTAFVSLSIQAGWIGVEEITVLALVLNFGKIFLVSPFSLSLAGSAYVGKAMGANQAAKAETFAKISIGLSIAQAFAIGVGLFAFRDLWPLVFTTDIEIRKTFADKVIFFAVLFVPESLQITLSGILNSLEK
jgi:Na+-driven multidrug efflux pump